METGAGGIFAFSWAQVEVEDIPSPPLQLVTTGALWRWRGEALRLDGPQGLLPLGPPEGAAELRARAARGLRRWLKSPVTRAGKRPEQQAGEAEPAPLRQGLVVTDGHNAWEVTLVPAGPGRPPIAVIAGPLPPQMHDLWVVEADIVADSETMPDSLCCFTPGAMILCEGGWHRVENITEGMRVQTRDNGCQPVLRRVSQQLGGARLHLMPQLAPVRLRMGGGTLVVSPDHHVMLQGPRAQALFGCDEVLAAARDLVDDRNARILRGLPEVHYLHLALERHEVILANGIETESFLPGEAASFPLPARRLLNRAETALVARAA